MSPTPSGWWKIHHIIQIFGGLLINKVDKFECCTLNSYSCCPHQNWTTWCPMSLDHDVFFLSFHAVHACEERRTATNSGGQSHYHLLPHGVLNVPGSSIRNRLPFSLGFLQSPSWTWTSFRGMKNAASTKVLAIIKVSLRTHANSI